MPRSLEGHEVVGVEQDDEGVTVTARDVDSGAEVTQRAHYLVAADGAHSVVRDTLGIPFEGRGTFSNSITIYFTADLWPQMGGKPLSVIYINNPAFGGFFRLSKDCQTGFLVVNTVGDPSVAPTSDAAADTSEARLVELVRIGTGVPDLDVRIDGVARWRASTDVAGRYQDGRVFLAGDAAHVMPPNGGFGGNTGIADAYDVAWKLALAVKGVAGPGLLATYEQERRPVGRLTVEQAYARYVTRTATYLGATDHQPVLPDLEVELGYVYRSPAVSGDDGSDPTVGHLDPRTARGRPGTRAPHLWIDDGGAPMSTLDLMGRHFVLLTGSAGRRGATPRRRSPKRCRVSPSTSTSSATGAGGYGRARSARAMASTRTGRCWSARTASWRGERRSEAPITWTSSVPRSGRRCRLRDRRREDGSCTLTRSPRGLTHRRAWCGCRAASSPWGRITTTPRRLPPTGWPSTVSGSIAARSPTSSGHRSSRPLAT